MDVGFVVFVLDEVLTFPLCFGYQVLSLGYIVQLDQMNKKSKKVDLTRLTKLPTTKMRRLIIKRVHYEKLQC